MLVVLDITLIGIVVGSTQLNNDINKPKSLKEFYQKSA
jgi:hypothetical protein